MTTKSNTEIILDDAAIAEIATRGSYLDLPVSESGPVVVLTEAERDALIQTVRAADNEVRAVLEELGKDVVHVRENSGSENIYASLAVSVRRLRNVIADHREDLEERTEQRDVWRARIGHTDCGACLDADAKAVAAIVSAVTNAADSMRSRCVEKVRAMGQERAGPWFADAAEEIAKGLESVSIQEQEAKQL